MQRRPVICSGRANTRLVIVISAVVGLLGFSVYLIAREQLSHGVVQDGNFYRVDLKKMGFFSFNEYQDGVDRIPPQFRALDGKELALEGFAYSPNDSSNHAVKYQFVYNVTLCCFKGPPLVQERVYATVKNPAAAPIYDGEFRIFGKLHINTVRDEVGKIEELYQLDVERSEPL